MIRTYFNAKNLYKLTVNFVLTCLQCQRMVKSLTSGQDRAYVPRLLSIDCKPFDEVAYDLLVLPEAGGFRHALVVQDALTRFVIAVPLKDKRAETVATALYDHVISPYFVPRIFLTDLESSFHGKVMDAFRDSLKILSHSVKVGGHSSLFVERSLKTLVAWLMNLLEYRYDCWPKLLSSVVKAFNLTKSTELQLSQ